VIAAHCLMRLALPVCRSSVHTHAMKVAKDSDVDLLVEFSRPIGLFEFVRLQRQLGELVGHQVDLVTPSALKPQLRDRILHEAVVAA
jgi:predicted nucleotidyltransferase